MRDLKDKTILIFGGAIGIAAAVVFLFSSDSEWVNEQTWHVNGGVSLAN